MRKVKQNRGASRSSRSAPKLVLVETGESRTPLFTTSSSITKATFYCESSSKLLNTDPANLLYELLDKLVALGDVAWQLNHALGRNGHRPKEVAKLIQDLERLNK